MEALATAAYLGGGDETTVMHIGFIGIGRIGLPMAARLLAAGHKLFIYDVARDRCRLLEKDGAVLCADPGEVARRADYIVTSLPGPAEVDAVIAGAQGILTRIRPGAIVIETSTIGPDQSRALAVRCAEKQAAFLEAPVSGGVPSAESGKLTAIVGGDATVLAQARPVLECFAARIYHLGPAGNGSVAKLINQMVFLSYVALFCEATALGKRAGLDVPALIEVLRVSVAGQPLMNPWEKPIESGDWSAGFPIKAALKDLTLGAEVCADRQHAAPVFQAALEAFRAAAESGHADKGMTALYAMAAGLLAP
jgi:3-hydroxyisobutyrate dehydrogenase-like beta-hydroxyacid dehydrogenase